MIYLDHAATTPMDPILIDAAAEYMTKLYGNPGSTHLCGRGAKAAVDSAREKVAWFFGCEPEQVIFTSGGSEGNNTVFFGMKKELASRGRMSVAISATEHDSVLKAARAAYGSAVRTVLPGSDGTYGAEQTGELIRTDDHPGLVSVMTVNNETGLVNDVKAIGEACRKNGVLFHTDAVQAAGIMPVCAEDLNADLITVASHKINGPKGVGALYVRDPSWLTPLIFGGADQEFGLRGGTENVAGIVCFGEACRIATEHMASRRAYLECQQSQLIYELKSLAKLKGLDVRINGSVEKLCPKTFSLCIPGVDANTLLLMLDARGVCVSAGSACRAHEDRPSHVLKAMGLSDEDARCSIRISISHLNTPQELDEAATAIIDCAVRLKQS